MATRLSASARRSQLIDTAVEVFAAQGYHATTMDQVAEAAGVTKPVVYHHFESKRDLFLVLLGEVGRLLAETVTTATAAARSPREQVLFGFRAYFRFVATHTSAFRLLFGDGVRLDSEFALAVQIVERELAELIASMITIEHLDDEGRLVLAHGIVGLAEATGRHWYLNGQSGDVADLADQVADLAWSGLRGRGRS